MTAPALGNFVAQRSISTGTGDFSLTTILGRQSLASAAGGLGAGFPIFYFISNPNAAEWEEGIGYMADVSTLVRSVVENSSNGGSAVNFTAGTKDVINDLPAQYQTALVKPPYRLVTAPGAVTLLASDGIVEIDKATPATTAVIVDPTILVVGKLYTVKLSKDDGVTNQVTITPSSGNFDGAGSYTLSYPRQAVTFFSNGTNLRAIA